VHIKETSNSTRQMVWFGSDSNIRCA